MIRRIGVLVLLVGSLAGVVSTLFGTDADNTADSTSTLVDSITAIETNGAAMSDGAALDTPPPSAAVAEQTTTTVAQSSVQVPTTADPATVLPLGGFAPYAFDPRDGETKPVRSETDGFHLNRTGEEILAVYVNTAVTEALKARGAAIG